MKIEKLVVGNTYYIPHGTWDYKKGVLIRILNNKKVLLEDKSGKVFQCSADRLHTVPYKAVAGYKARERVKQQMKVIEQRDKENLVDKNVQKKVKKLGHSIYATMEKDKYIVIGYSGLPQPRFSTLEELDKWADDELIKLEVRREEIRSKGYKYLKIEDKNGKANYYQNLNFIFTKFEIRCKNFKGNIGEIPDDKILNRNDIPEMKINVAR